jgi:hypothetical protein
MPYVIALLAAIVALGFGGWRLHGQGYAKGYKDRDLSCVAEKAELESARAEAERQAQAVREKGRIVADRMAEELATTRAQLASAHERMTRELQARASASRRCFSGSVASLLNSSSPIRESTASGDQTGPAAAGVASATAGPAASDDGSAVSELAAAVAIGQARTAFAACKQQLRAVLIATDNPPIE